MKSDVIKKIVADVDSDITEAKRVYAYNQINCAKAKIARAEFLLAGATAMVEAAKEEYRVLTEETLKEL